MLQDTSLVSAHFEMLNLGIYAMRTAVFWESIMTVLVMAGQEGLELGGATTIEQLIWALQGSHGRSHEAWHSAADHLLRIAGART